MHNLAWSVGLSAFGLVALFLSPRKPVLGSVIGIVDQFLWIVYAIVTCQYGFCLSALVYGGVFASNLRHGMGKNVRRSRAENR